MLIVETLLYHSCATLSSNPSALLESARQSIGTGEVDAKKIIAESPLVQSIFAAGLVAIRAKKDQTTVAELLAPLTTEFTYAEASALFEGLVSERLWRYARWHAAAWGAHSRAPANNTKWNFKGEQGDVARMVDFVTDNIQVLAFGDGNVEGSSGVMHQIPAYLRKAARGELYAEYKKKQKNDSQKALSKSEYVKFMGKVSKSDPKAMSALDPGSVRGKGAIDRLSRSHLPELSLVLGLPKADQDGLAAELDAVAQSIGSLSKHLEETDMPACPSHCFAHQLGDPTGKDPSRAVPCDHEHHGRCSICEAPRVVRAKLEGLLGQLASFPGAADEPQAHKELRGLIQRDLELMDSYHSHEFRAAYEKSMPAKMMEEMDEGVCFTTSDWKMKFMAFFFRSQLTHLTAPLAVQSLTSVAL